MLEDEYTNKYLSHLKGLFNEENPSSQEIESIKRKIDETLFLKDKVTMLSNVRTYSIIYISENLKALTGYTQQELYDMKASAFFKLTSFSHYSYPFKSLKYSKQFGLSILEKNRKHISFTSCGLRVKNKRGQEKRVMVRSHVFSLDKEFKPLILIEYIEDLTSIYKGKHYWMRWKCLDQTFAYVHQNGKKEFGDILSKREKEIVDFIIIGKTNQQIANTLRLSKTTIETHRKNILRRTGFKTIESLGFIWNKIR